MTQIINFAILVETRRVHFGEDFKFLVKSFLYLISRFVRRLATPLSTCLNIQKSKVSYFRGGTEILSISSSKPFQTCFFKRTISYFPGYGTCENAWLSIHIPISLHQGILKGKYHFTVDLLFDWFGLVCFCK
jgi:hypothetical protein